jgi:alkylated DNA repair protein (DNA oxidative demethylase)
MAARSRNRCSTIWDAVSGVDRAPQCCLVNYYDAAARMGLHQDRDEADFTMPVVSISLGDAALFRVGGTSRGARRNRSG